MRAPRPEASTLKRSLQNDQIMVARGHRSPMKRRNCSGVFDLSRSPELTILALPDRLARSIPASAKPASVKASAEDKPLKCIHVPVKVSVHHTLSSALVSLQSLIVAEVPSQMIFASIKPGPGGLSAKADFSYVGVGMFGKYFLGQKNVLMRRNVAGNLLGPLSLIRDIYVLEPFGCERQS